MKTLPISRLGRVTLPLGMAAILTLSACGGGSTSDDSADGSSDASKFSINIDDCEDPESVTAPITGTFDVGYSAPLSGPVAGVVEINRAGFDARVAAANAAKELGDVEIKVNYKDDAFGPDKAKANGTEFLAERQGRLAGHLRHRPAERHGR